MSDKAKYKCAAKGDYVYNMMRMWQGAAGIAPVDGLVSPAYVVAKPLPHVNPAYFASLFRTDGYLAEIDAFSRGIVKDRNRLYWDQFKQIPTPCPPPEEQKAIVRFLTWATNRLDRAIRAKRRIIALLNEQKQAIIHRAVTRGLDPSVPLKDSGIPWLGVIPEHWEVLRCRYIFREVDKRSSDGSEQHLSMSQRLGLVPSDLVANRTLVSESYAGGKLCEVGDLVLNRLKAHLGVFALARHVGVISPDYTVLRPITTGGLEYFERILQSPACRHELRMRAKGIVEGFWRLYTDDFYNIRLPVPPSSEREDIAAHFGEETKPVQESALRAEREIGLLYEYRTRLIADVVTGKLDVRQAAAGLPEEMEIHDELDEIIAEDEADVFSLVDTEAELDVA
jgi:type I restriction enzyme S subunit